MPEVKIKTPNSSIYDEIMANWTKKTTDDFTLGKLEKMVADYGSMVGGDLPAELKTAMILMCGDHGIAKYGVSAYPQEVTLQMINGYMRETAGANVMARHGGADVFVVDVGTVFDLNHFDKVHHEKVALGTEDFTKGPAMTQEQAEKALAVGMKMANDCIDQGYNLLETAEMGIANTTATAAIAAAFLDIDPELTVGRGTGINDERMRVKIDVVKKGLAKNKPKVNDAMDVLTKVGGYDHAGLAGVIIAGAQRNVPTMVDGVNATAAALLAYGLYPECRKYMLCSHLSSDLSHKKMLEILQLRPIVDAGMRLGEGTGASLAISVLNVALKTYHDL